MSAALIDVGALIALLDADDRAHDRVVEALKSLEATLVTVWPALTEAAHLLGDVSGGPDALCDMISDEALAIAALDVSDLSRMKELMRKYRDLPMDFADAALVRVAERDGVPTILTLDRQFSVYALPRRRRFVVWPSRSGT